MRARFFARCAIVVSIAAPTAPAFAQQNNALMPTFGFQPKPTPPVRPYVFRIPMPLAPPAQKPTELGKPTVVCGMTLIPADPAFDSAIRKNALATATSFTITRIQPKACTRP